MEYGYYFSWDNKHISGTGFKTDKEARQAFSNALHVFGYRFPKWWQVWRWGEHTPPRDLPEPKVKIQ